MKKIFILFVLIAFTTGCSFVPGLGKKSASKTSSKTILLTKKEAIRAAQDFLAAEGLDEEFTPRKPHKIKRMRTFEDNSKWIWKIHFPSRSVPFGRFWKRAPLAVEVDAQTGEIVRWGRRYYEGGIEAHNRASNFSSRINIRPQYPY